MKIQFCMVFSRKSHTKSPPGLQDLFIYLLKNLLKFKLYSIKGGRNILTI